MDGQTDRPASLMVGRVGGEADPQEVLHTLQATSLNGCEECTLTLGGSGVTCELSSYPGGDCYGPHLVVQLSCYGASSVL